MSDLKNLRVLGTLQGKIMKKIILTAIVLFSTSLIAEVVHYDVRDTKKPQITKPNHPTIDLYTK